MIEVDVERWDVTIRLVGIVRDNDWDAAVSMLEQKLGPPASWHVVSAGSHLRVLMDWENLEGWEERARSGCTWFCMGNQDLVERLAIVGDERWRDEKDRMVDIYKRAQVHFFSPAERDQAVKWLKQVDR